MVKAIVGIVATAIVLTIFGFIFWGAATVPYQSLQTVPDSGAAQSALATHFPEVGTYLIPGSPAETKNAEVVAKQYESGPVAMIHITSQGRPLMDPSIMISCFILNVLLSPHWRLCSGSRAPLSSGTSRGYHSLPPFLRWLL